jgi:hypothetical protein
MSIADIQAQSAAQAMLAFNNCAATVNGTSVLGVFDSAYAQSEFVAGTSPILEMAAADAVGVEFADPVVINGDSYTVANIKSSGDGLVILILEAV